MRAVEAARAALESYLETDDYNFVDVSDSRWITKLSRFPGDVNTQIKNIDTGIVLRVHSILSLPAEGSRTKMHFYFVRYGDFAPAYGYMGTR